MLRGSIIQIVSFRYTIVLTPKNFFTLETKCMTHNFLTHSFIHLFDIQCINNIKEGVFMKKVMDYLWTKKNQIMITVTVTVSPDHILRNQKYCLEVFSFSKHSYQISLIILEQQFMTLNLCSSIDNYYIALDLDGMN